MAIEAKNIKTTINDLMTKALELNTSEAEKKANIAEALAYFIQLESSGGQGSINIDNERLNRDLDRIYNSDALNAVQRQGRLSEFAALSPKDLNDRLNSLDNEISQYAGPGEENPKRASKLYDQMNSTWRVASNSKEFEAAKKAMQDISQKEKPTQLDNYLAADTVKKYVAKNLSKAKSAAGMTRMAVSLAFLKQTMSKESFEAYCSNLNGLRGIKSNKGDNGLISFDKNNPRCIEPDTIGTVKEVYQNFRERFHEYSAGTMQDKPIDPRDIAMLTALKNLQAKSKNGENLVVEHEALVAELEKVQKDKRFTNAMKTKSREELLEMAWGGNFDTLDGYSKPMTPEQQERVKAEKERIAREDPKNQFENAKNAFKDKAEPGKELNNKDNRPTFEAIDKAEKEAEEFRKNHRSLKALYNDVLPQIKEMGKPLNPAFSAIEDQAAQDAGTELFAKMIAIGEYQEKLAGKKDISDEDMQVDIKEFNERVDTLKKDPLVAEMAKNLKNDPGMPRVIENYDKVAESKTFLFKENRKLFPAIHMSDRVNKMYHKAVDKAKNEAEPITVKDVYGGFTQNIGRIINGKLTLPKMAGMVAMAVAAQEFKGNGTDDTQMDPKAFLNRAEVLKKDPSIMTAAQSMCGPTKQSEMQKKFATSKDQGKDFAEMAKGMYDDVVKKKQAGQEKKAEQAGKGIGM